MRPRTVAILLTALARAATAAVGGTDAWRWPSSRGSCWAVGRPALTRPPVTQPELLTLRTTSDEQAVAAGRRMLGRVLERTKAEYDRYTTGERQAPPVIDILIVSGGGTGGPSGRGFSKGGSRCPPSTHSPSPEFTR